METAKLIIEVVAGVIPEKPDPAYTRRYTVSSEEWHIASGAPDGQGELLATISGKAQGYAGWLMLQPDRLNWVRTDWIWL